MGYCWSSISISKMDWFVSLEQVITLKRPFKSVFRLWVAMHHRGPGDTGRDCSTPNYTHAIQNIIIYHNWHFQLSNKVHNPHLWRKQKQTVWWRQSNFLCSSLRRLMSLRTNTSEHDRKSADDVNVFLFTALLPAERSMNQTCFET